MSYILDALNKSEQERKEQGHVPSLHAVHSSAPDPIKQRLIIWIPLAILLAFLAAFILFKLFNGAADNSQTSPAENSPVLTGQNKAQQFSSNQNLTEQATAAAIPPSQTPIDKAAVAPAPNPATEPRPAGKPSNQVASLYQKNSPAPPPMTTSNQESAARTDSESETFTPAPAAPARSIAATSAADSAMNYAKMAEIVANEINRIKQEEQILDVSHPRSNNKAVASNPAAEKLAPRPAPQETSPAAEPAAQAEMRTKKVIRKEVPHVSELPLSVQAAIPSIEFSAHVYAINEGAGFVILNGVTRHPGDKLNADITVEGIYEDGVILSYQGIEFCLYSMRDWINN